MWGWYAPSQIFCFDLHVRVVRIILGVTVVDRLRAGGSGFDYRQGITIYSPGRYTLTSRPKTCKCSHSTDDTSPYFPPAHTHTRDFITRYKWQSCCLHLHTWWPHRSLEVTLKSREGRTFLSKNTNILNNYELTVIFGIYQWDRGIKTWQCTVYDHQSRDLSVSSCTLFPLYMLITFHYHRTDS